MIILWFKLLIKIMKCTISQVIFSTQYALDAKKFGFYFIFFSGKKTNKWTQWFYLIWGREKTDEEEQVYGRN